jgi:hypothetical protein
MGLGFVYAKAGERQQAEEVLKKLQEIGRCQQYVPPVLCAAVFAGLGERDQAFDCLRRAAQERNWQVAWLTSIQYVERRGREERWQASPPVRALRSQAHVSDEAGRIRLRCLDAGPNRWA